MSPSYSVLENADNYFAHLPFNGDDSLKETLKEHSDLVFQYTLMLENKHHLSPIINQLLKSVLGKKWSERLQSELTDLWYESIYFHDLGKINPNFQVRKMKNMKFELKQLNFSSDHSLPGYILFLLYCFEKIDRLKLDEESEIILIAFSILIGFQISKHHSSHLDNLTDYLGYKFDFKTEDVLNYFNDITKITNDYKIKELDDFNLKSLDGVKSFIKEVLENDLNDSFSLFALLKLHYSLLTASDYLATSHYMNQWGEELMSDFGTIDESLRQKIIRNAKSIQSYNKKVYDELEGFNFVCPQEQSNENLNQLRKELAVEVIQNIRKYNKDLVYYIEAPTGGGKTNLSMLALAELMEFHSIKNVFYVFPFTTLITQTYKSLKDTLGLNEDELIELHSKAGFPEKNNTAQYGKDKQNHIDYLFANYPISLLSHVKFFDILKTNRKEQNYLLHRLANSVVIVDELQSYNPKDWDKLIYFIDNYARQFNIRFILMSATLPKLGNMEHVESEVRFLIHDKNKYFQNPNFSNRVEFDYSLLDWAIPNKDDKPTFLENLADKVLEESIGYANINTKYPNSVFSIIEFIFKQTATDFYEIINEKHSGFFDEIFVLSGTILEFRRKEIIQYLKNEENRNKKILLITTQVVEAGVDIDMDLGFKDQSLVDSDEQLAGRINRNVNKPACKLFLFNCDKATIIYGRDNRYKLMQKEFYKDYKDILTTKNFDRLYNEVMSRLDANSMNTMKKGFDDFEDHVKALRFQTIDDEFKIIDQYNESIFVPLSIPVYVPNTDKKERNFSEKDLEFLAYYDINISNQVNGEQIFNLYGQLIREPNPDFVTQKTEMKKAARYHESIYIFVNG